jgi:hypothetical protein
MAAVIYSGHLIWWETMTELLLAWYVYCILLFILWRTFWCMTNLPRFRGPDGDITTEAGYFEDETGLPLKLPENEYDTDPHIAYGADHHTGSAMF